ncbi:uncharacterized protein LOC126371584 [Pectinophora gossypiella]|nr:uncharacterized protein LOC126371584 [Pectinophora gossypiella]
MANAYGVSEAELNIAKQQAARRAELRKEFIKQKTNPWKNAAEAGYVFDPAMQKFTSMKATHFQLFKPNRSNSLFGIFAVVVPMLTYGYLIYNERTAREAKIRSGETKYRERMFKLA